MSSTANEAALSCSFLRGCAEEGFTHPAVPSALQSGTQPSVPRGNRTGTLLPLPYYIWLGTVKVFGSGMVLPCRPHALQYAGMGLC